MVSELGGNVVYQFDSSELSALEFIRKLRDVFTEYGTESSVIVIEDVPYGISSQKMTKQVTRLQGAIILLLASHHVVDLDDAVFLNPSSWQKHFPGVARGEKTAREAAARQHADDLGYQPPQLVQAYMDSVPEGKRPLKKYINPLAKIETDYIDAFLITQWAFKFKDRAELLKESGVQEPFL